MGQKKYIAIFLLLIFILSGCATSVSLRVERTPTMNTAGIRRIAIMPFETSDFSSQQNEIAQFITATAIDKIRAINYFTLVDHTEITRLQSRGESIANHVDALFTGQIVSMRTANSSHVVERKDSKTKEVTQHTIYDREVELVFTYRLIRARDGTIIDMITKQGKSEDHQESRNNLQSVSQLAQTIVNSNLARLARDVAPYTATESRSLMQETSRDKTLKNRMKDAVTLVKNGNYRSALDTYLAIYNDYNNFAAVYNAAIMYEAVGEAHTAAILMEQVYNETGNPKAYDALIRLNRNLREQAILASEYGDTGDPRSRVVAFAVSEIQKVLPRNARVWVFNNSSDEKDLADIIADTMIFGFLRNGVIIVDRENGRLLEAEQRFQMSGYVSDDDFVSIGNAAGANILVTVAITGVSSMRRLQVRVLDIETGTSILQSDANDNWKL